MTTFKQFLENQEKQQPIRIRMSDNWGDTRKSTTDESEPTINPEDFIQEFNDEVGATKNPMHRNEYIYEDDLSIIKYKLEPYGSSVYVSSLQINPRNPSVVFRFLAKLTKLADQHQIKLRCFSSPLDVPNKVNINRLTNLYKRYGFTPDPHSEDKYQLIRKPK